ncbi:MAG: UxaA family hydrolase [Thermomicrobiales bacterium]
MTTRIPVSGAGLTPGAPKGPVPINELTVRLDPADKLVIAKTTLLPGTVLQQDDGSEIRVRQLIPQGHKVALAEVAAGDEILKYGQIIGFATQPIEIGQHIHSHNLAVGELHLDYAMSSAYEPVEILPVEEQAPGWDTGDRTVRVGAAQLCCRDGVGQLFVVGNGGRGRVFPDTWRAGRVSERRWGSSRTRADAARTSGRSICTSCSERWPGSSITRTSPDT